MSPDASLTAEAVARRSYGKLLAYLVVRTRDVAAAEDALADAFAAAITDWPSTGCPANPEAWLLAVARRKVIDTVRRQETRDRFAAEVEALAQPPHGVDIPDERLVMLFACAHPAIDERVRAPLLLQVVMGVDAARIARAFLMSPGAMSKRLVRAKEKIRAVRIPFRVPEPEELPSRLASVLDAIYGAYAEGWTDPTATDAQRTELAEEALSLARLVVELLPDQPEARGLLALLLHADARRRARRDANGEYVPLDRQDQSRWDWHAIGEAESHIVRFATARTVGRYQLEAALQSAHVYRCRSGTANWDDIVRLYDVLQTQVVDSLVVSLNRAIAIGNRDGPDAALRLLDALATDDRMTSYQPYWAARADTLATLGRTADAVTAYDRAIGLERDEAVRRYLARQREVARAH